MEVSLEVVPHCTVAAEPLAFGTLAVATANIEVACGPYVPFTIALDDGQNAGAGTRRALDPVTGAYVTYDIFVDASHSQRWGSSGGQAVSGVTTSTGTAHLTAHGAAIETEAVAGGYRDVVTVTAVF